MANDVDSWTENNELYDLGNGTTAVWLTSSDGHAVGLIEYHVCDDEKNNKGLAPGLFGKAVMLDLGYGPTQTWTVEAGEAGVWEGLTLSPSIACPWCSHHGWIRDGKWVDA